MSSRIDLFYRFKIGDITKKLGKKFVGGRDRRAIGKLVRTRSLIYLTEKMAAKNKAAAVAEMKIILIKCQ